MSQTSWGILLGVLLGLLPALGVLIGLELHWRRERLRYSESRHQVGGRKS